MRQSSCNFICGLHNGNGVGKIGPDGKEITWWCDTETVWKSGKSWSFHEVVVWLKEVGEWERVMTGHTHIIQSGGEPTMKSNAEAFMALIDHMNMVWDKENPTAPRDIGVDVKHYGYEPHASMNPVLNRLPRIEVETNGSIGGEHVERLLTNYISQVNCSAKLANSGMPFSMRVRPDALEQIRQHPNHWWKFVVSQKSDWSEIMEDYGPALFYKYPEELNRIILMPAGSTTPELRETAQAAWDMAVEHNVRFCDRYQVRVWEMATGK
ncbi:MAG: hypothetical protein LC650_02155 [Actinobacteria bacterium]|nr:hypothetical protein [Actinomycetota bacterium]